jgi:acyl-CoA thioester hydrolase
MIKRPVKTNNTSIVAVKDGYVRFSEVDSLHMVWHGNYIRYFEDGREAFGMQYGLGYLEVHEHGYVTPIVRTECDYKRPLRYGEKFRIETRFINSSAAKLIFDYTIFNLTTNQISATGRTIQVFLDGEGELQLTNPPFFEEWKQKMGLE